ncbi:hypothetical protein DPMN_131728 [Dreissena polymorpha]|uniref:Uncharacterized protein n=1 Tax=Dreissena polymorpha TaxID=45954 RepID=A0A9D4JD32_DREPO|nr:hypothetical protein DPMN_131728 [Dreissena polymorpha]
MRFWSSPKHDFLKPCRDRALHDGKQKREIETPRWTRAKRVLTIICTFCAVSHGRYGS